MTREEIIDFCDMKAQLEPENENIFNVIIKALKQELIIDKIRDQLKSNLRGVEITLEVLVENDPLRPKMEGAKTTLEDCLELIDMIESEDEYDRS